MEKDDWYLVLFFLMLGIASTIPAWILEGNLVFAFFSLFITVFLFYIVFWESLLSWSSWEPESGKSTKLNEWVKKQEDLYDESQKYLQGLIIGLAGLSFVLPFLAAFIPGLEILFIPWIICFIGLLITIPIFALWAVAPKLAHGYVALLKTKITYEQRVENAKKFLILTPLTSLGVTLLFVGLFPHHLILSVLPIPDAYYLILLNGVIFIVFYFLLVQYPFGKGVKAWKKKERDDINEKRNDLEKVEEKASPTTESEILVSIDKQIKLLNLRLKEEAVDGKANYVFIKTSIIIGLITTLLSSTTYELLVLLASIAPP
ncbi:MAG: hypothetical protein ACFE89_06460 [Candidatus Hodarchaeota archaeon]